MTAEHKYIWPERALLFEADDRVDPDLFLLATRAWGFMDATLDGLRMDRTLPEFASRLLLVYFGARIHGATTAGTMLLTQRLGREATIMARCQYDYFLKMLYYDTYHSEANKALELLDKGAYNYVFHKKAGSDLSKLDPAEVARVRPLAKDAKELNFTNEVVRRLKEDSEFIGAADDGNPFAKWFLQNVEASFRTHWTYGSSIVHASPVDIPNVVVPRPDTHFTVNVDSRMKAPNKTIADLTQRCFSAMGLIRWRFGLPFTDEHTPWSTEFQAVADRHKDEPADVRSMHD
jgi:hypothetical protein